MRSCPEKLKEYIDSKWKTKAEMPEDFKATECLAGAAEECIGIKSSDKEMIELFERAEGSEAGEQSWCMDFAQAIISYVEETMNIKSTLSSTQGCLDLWNKNPNARMNKPEVGSVAIWRHGVGPLGHCGIVTECDNLPIFHTVEGNTSDSQEVERTGDGVHEKRRMLGTSGDFTLVGFLRAFS